MPDLPRADKEQCGAFIVSLHSPIMGGLLRRTIYLPSLPNLRLMFWANSVTNGYWLSGRTTWMASYPYAAILKITSSSWFGPGGTHSQVSFLDPVSPAALVVTYPRRTWLLRMWILTRRRGRPSRPPRLSQSQARRSPFRAARFGDGGLVQRQDRRPLHVTWSGAGGALGRLGTLPRCMVASAWRCQRVSITFFLIAFVLTGHHILLDFIGSGVNILFQEWRLTNDYKRFALLATTPFLFCVSLVCTSFLLRLCMSSQCWSTVFLSASDHEYFLRVGQACLDVWRVTHNTS